MAGLGDSGRLNARGSAAVLQQYGRVSCLSAQPWPLLSVVCVWGGPSAETRAMLACCPRCCCPLTGLLPPLQEGPLLARQVSPTVMAFKKIRFGRSSKHGYGAYADEVIREDETIVEYIGQLIRIPFLDARQENRGTSRWQGPGRWRLLLLMLALPLAAGGSLTRLRTALQGAEVRRAGLGLELPLPDR